MVMVVVMVLLLVLRRTHLSDVAIAFHSPSISLTARPNVWLAGQNRLTGILSLCTVLSQCPVCRGPDTQLEPEPYCRCIGDKHVPCSAWYRLLHWELLVRQNRLVGLVVKVSASGAEDPEFDSRLRRDFSGSSQTSDLKIGTPVATLPGASRCRVSTDWLARCQYTVTR